MLLCCWTVLNKNFKDTGTTFLGAYISDSLSIFFKIPFVLNIFLAIIISLDFLKKSAVYGRIFHPVIIGYVGNIVNGFQPGVDNPISYAIPNRIFVI